MREPPLNYLSKPGQDDIIRLEWAVVFMREAPCYGTRVNKMMVIAVYIKYRKHGFVVSLLR